MMLLKAHHKIFNSQHLYFTPVLLKIPLRYPQKALMKMNTISAIVA